MFVAKKPTRNPGHFRVIIVDNYRENGKVKQKIVRTIGTAHNDEELAQYIKLAYSCLEHEIAKKNKCELLFKYGDDLDELAKINKSVLKFNAQSLKEEKRVHEGIESVYGDLFDSLGFSKIMDTPSSSKLLKELVLARILNPLSKLKTSEFLEKDCNKSVSIDSIYRLMDRLEKKESNVLSAAFEATSSLFEGKVDVLFFDVTTLYFESTEEDDELKGFGFSKDAKFNQVQVVLALATTLEGLPVGFKLFRGNTAETKTLISCINDWKKVLAIENVIFVADRAMFSKDNMYEIEKNGYTYIIAAKLRSMDKQTQSKIFSEDGYKAYGFSDEVIWHKELNHEIEHKVLVNEEKKKSIILNSRLITSFSSKRARKDQKDREKQLDKIEKYLDKKTKKSQTKKLVTNAALKKFCHFEGSSVASLNKEKILKDALWDGMHGVITNSDKPASEILSRYRSLWQIEESFRLSKTDLKIRPIYHYKPARIKAHILICFLSLCLMRHLQVRLRRANIGLSLQKINEELRRVQYSICKDHSTGFRLKIPSSTNETAQQVYAALGLHRKQAISIFK